MIGVVCLMVRHESANVVGVNDCIYLESDSPIISDFQDGMWSCERLFLFVFSPSAEEDLVSFLVGMFDALGILSFIVFVDNVLLALSNVLPVCCVFDVENHVSSKHKLSW